MTKGKRWEALGSHLQIKWKFMFISIYFNIIDICEFVTISSVGMADNFRYNSTYGLSFEQFFFQSNIHISLHDLTTILKYFNSGGLHYITSTDSPTCLRNNNKQKLKSFCMTLETGQKHQEDKIQKRCTSTYHSHSNIRFWYKSLASQYRILGYIHPSLAKSYLIMSDPLKCRIISRVDIW